MKFPGWIIAVIALIAVFSIGSWRGEWAAKTALLPKVWQTAQRAEQLEEAVEQFKGAMKGDRLDSNLLDPNPIGEPTRFSKWQEAKLREGGKTDVSKIKSKPIPRPRRAIPR